MPAYRGRNVTLMKNGKNRIRAALAALLLFLSLCGCAGAEGEKPLMEVHQLMLGCADGYFIRLGDVAIAIDCGRDDGDTAERALEALRQAGCEKLTAYIATHYHDDHAGNMREILAAFGTEDTFVFGPTETYPKKYGTLPVGVWREMKAGDELSFGGMTIKCVGPDKLEGRGGINKDSLNFVVRYGARSFLFTGDYVRSHPVADGYRDDVTNVDVLKFPHHGLRPFCIDPWVLMQVNPKIILIPGATVGPVMQLAEKYGVDAKVYSIGDGHMVITTDGETLEVATHVGE